MRGRDDYQRTMEGWADSGDDASFIHTVKLREPERELHVRVVALPSPSYEIREATCRCLAGDVAPAVCEGFARLVGIRMAAGFTRRVLETLPSEAGSALALDAAIEVARLARQVIKLPPERAARAAGGDPWECWQLDTTGWVDLPDSCFTYSEAGRAAFGTRAVSTPIRPDLYGPRPGQLRVFHRRKRVRLSRDGDRLRLVHSMHDDIHGFEIRCEIDLATATVVAADSVTSRLPYMGICSEPQGKIGLLVGERVDTEFRKRLQTLLGGNAGCAQLYELTADLVKLLGPIAGSPRRS